MRPLGLAPGGKAGADSRSRWWPSNSAVLLGAWSNSPAERPLRVDALEGRAPAEQAMRLESTTSVMW